MVARRRRRRPGRRAQARAPARIAAPFVVPVAARRPSSPAGSACRPPESAAEQLLGRPTSARCVSPPAARGASSRPSSVPRTTRCRPTTSRTTRTGGRPPHLADQHRDVPARDRHRPRLRLDRDRRDGRAARGDARDDRRASSGSAATSTTGTTRATCTGSSPHYVSSVDSGNLAGHLLALSNACRQMIDQPLPVAAAAGRHR